MVLSPLSLSPLVSLYQLNNQYVYKIASTLFCICCIHLLYVPPQKIQYLLAWLLLRLTYLLLFCITHMLYFAIKKNFNTYFVHLLVLLLLPIFFTISLNSTHTFEFMSSYIVLVRFQFPYSPEIFSFIIILSIKIPAAF